MISNSIETNFQNSTYGRNETSDLSVQAVNRIEVLKVLSNTILRELNSFGFEQTAKTTDKMDLAEEVRKFETDLICRALISAKGKQRQAAKLLNVKITTLNAKIKRYGINPNGL